MERPPFMDFAPVPCRRRDGWTEARQRRFIVGIARGHSAAEAAGAVGMSRQTAYGLRSRAGGEEFARAWDQASDFARQVRHHPSPAGPATLIPAVDRLLVPRFYRGRLVGFVERDDLAGAMRRLRALDRMHQPAKPTKLTK